MHNRTASPRSGELTPSFEGVTLGSATPATLILELVVRAVGVSIGIASLLTSALVVF